ncbi:winged helix-turn-helix transcriptional regulator [Kitasatospora sp. NPDC057223]|uniref:winged helix-turn-helix transcriptional regulator n=1 Tax=Kitasatospora sp. NPDC057223 TaxID=3346055 RepID=UPI0036279DEA
MTIEEHGTGVARPSPGQAGPGQPADDGPAQELDVFGQACPSRGMFAELADKWSLLILMSLAKVGEQRFSELQRSVGGVSRKMLTQSLRTLERHGLVRRTVYPQTPPRVAYDLLPLGRDLAGLVSPLGRWTERNTPQMLAVREEFDLAHDGPPAGVRGD